MGLVRAFAQNQSLQERANLVIVTHGLDNPLHEEASDNQTEQKVLAPIRELVQENHLWGKISAFSLPNQSALAAAYRFLARRRSVFALTSHHEPFGLGPLEAAIAGLPVVVTQNGGMTESLQEEDETYGVLIDPDDPRDIAQGLERLLSDAQAWERCARCGRQRVLKRYTWESTAEAYLNLIEQIVASPTARRPNDLPPIHPYFHNPRPENDVSLQELNHLYFGS